jgi:hypothetical protein
MLFDVKLTKEEIQHLAVWHKECELRFAEMREYQMADEAKQRTYIFEGIKNSSNFWK